MAASITHRGSGIVLYGGFFLLALWLLGLSFNRALYDGLAALFASPFGVVLIAGFVWSLVFHLFNGLRHLYWDSGRGLARNMARMTAWLVYVGATLATALVLWAALGQGSG